MTSSMVSITMAQNATALAIDRDREQKERAEEARAEEEKQKLDWAKEQQDRDQKWREQELQQRKRDKEERERPERIKLLPKHQPMSPKEDVADFLEMFKANMKDREIPKDSWAQHLLPLLNHNCKASTATLPIDQKYCYREILLATCQQGLQYPGQQGSLTQGESFRASAVRLLRMAHRFLPEDDPEVLRRKVALEVILRAFPKEVASYVREKETNDLFTAMDLASKYFKREGWDEFRFDTSKPWTHPKREEKEGRYGDYKKRGRSKYWSKDGESDSTCNKSDKETQGSHGRYVSSNTQGANGKAENKHKYEKPHSFRKGNNRQGCWECGEMGHERASCPKRLPKTQANTMRVTCLSLATSEPYTVPGSIGETLIDTGADMSLVAEDLVPPGTQMSKSVWVEGVGDQLQLYQTAKLPVTIMGQKTELTAAIAPIHHIPFAVILGRNVPGLKHT